MKQCMRGKVGPTMRPGGGPLWSPLFPALLRYLLTSSHGLLFPEKITWQKDWVRLTYGRSLKVKKTYKNKEIYFTVLKPNERGFFRKPLESMANKSRSS
jgi:hypothetical protein